MDFNTALGESLKEHSLTTEEDIEVVLQHLGRNQIRWKGLKLFQNIGSEEAWNRYKDKIGPQEGEYQIGPALHSAEEGEVIKYLADCVGLYYSK